MIHPENTQKKTQKSEFSRPKAPRKTSVRTTSIMGFLSDAETKWPLEFGHVSCSIYAYIYIHICTYICQLHMI